MLMVGDCETRRCPPELTHLKRVQRWFAGNMCAVCTTFDAFLVGQSFSYRKQNHARHIPAITPAESSYSISFVYPRLSSLAFSKASASADFSADKAWASLLDLICSLLNRASFSSDDSET